MKSLAGIVLVGVLATGAQAKPPMPEFLIKSNVDERIARLLAKDCPGLAFNHFGFDRHMRDRLGWLSDRGIAVRSSRNRYAPASQDRVARHMTAFLDRHGLTPDSGDDAFCAAGQAELEDRTPIGLMLQAAGKG